MINIMKIKISIMQTCNLQPCLQKVSFFNSSNIHKFLTMTATINANRLHAFLDGAAEPLKITQQSDCDNGSLSYKNEEIELLLQLMEQCLPVGTQEIGYILKLILLPLTLDPSRIFLAFKRSSTCWL